MISIWLSVLKSFDFTNYLDVNGKISHQRRVNTTGICKPLSSNLCKVAAMSSGKSQWLFKRLIQTTQHHSGLTCKILGMKAQHFVFNKHFMCAKLDTQYMAKGSKFEDLCRKEQMYPVMSTFRQEDNRSRESQSVLRLCQVA